MEFSGPTAADLANVTALNRAFLLQLRASPHGRQWRLRLPPAVQLMVKSVTDQQIGRLSAAPFLLLSLRERDTDYWRALCSDDPNLDLLLDADRDSHCARLSMAGLAFLWALATRNPYAARLVSGAALNWCEQLADCTLLCLLQRATGRGDLLRPRLADNEGFWRKLLGPGLSSERDVRQAAQLTALQSILTDDPAVRNRPMRAAACSTLAPSLRVADRNRRR